MNWQKLEETAALHGLILMGTCHDGDDTLALLGAGTGMWPEFTHSREYADGALHPLDRWSKRVIGCLAAQFGADTAFPSDGPPYAPFITWALATGRFWQSPVGMMIHDIAGLMISIRGALRFPGTLALQVPHGVPPCTSCAAQPCVIACPVQALQAKTPYDVSGCMDHLRTSDSADCMSAGCAARWACPVSQRFGRDSAQSAFHMVAFVGKQPPSNDPNT